MPPGSLQVTTPSEREIAMTRVFDAPRRLVFAAYTRPELLRRWLGVHNGWSFAVCEIDLRVGGSYRWVWRGPDGAEMGLRGVYREVVPDERIVATEKFDEAWYDGEAVGTVEFAEQDGRTTLTMTIRYGSRAIRDAVLKTPMSQGVGAGFAELERLLPSLAEAATRATIDAPRIVQTAAQPIAAIRLTIPRGEIRAVMGPGIGELMSTLAAQGIAPAGPWLNRHFRMDPGVFDFEIAVPVPRPVAPTGRVTNGELPAATVARTIYRGPYEGLGEAWGELDRWIREQGRTPAPALWEVYVAGPESSPDPATWRTELDRPLEAS